MVFNQKLLLYNTSGYGILVLGFLSDSCSELANHNRGKVSVGPIRILNVYRGKKRGRAIYDWLVSDWLKVAGNQSKREISFETILKTKALLRMNLLFAGSRQLSNGGQSSYGSPKTEDSTILSWRL